MEFSENLSMGMKLEESEIYLLRYLYSYTQDAVLKLDLLMLFTRFIVDMLLFRD